MAGGEWLTGNGIWPGNASTYEICWDNMPGAGYYESVPGSGLILNSSSIGWQTWDVTGMLQD